jgi:hypothetical protein
MTKFDKELFNYSGGFLMYGQYPDRPKFVARFKYKGGNRAGFQSFLIKNFTVDEYFGRLDANETPVGILESRGYVASHVKKMLKEAGFAPTVEGKDQYIARQVAQYAAA